jgi:radical SAM-linked protein
MMNLMARALRRARIPFALSEGFNPHIRLSMGTVLPVGLWGKREYFDLELEREMSINEFVDNMNQSLPPAMRINACLEIGIKTPALMNSINCACYSFVINDRTEQLELWKARTLQQEELMVKSRGKKKNLDKNLRPGILKIEVNRLQDFAIIDIWGTIGEPLNVRYDELRDLLLQTGIDKETVGDIYRSGNYIRERDKYYTPLEKVK